MIILSWNIRGLNKKEKKHLVNDIINIHKIDIIGIQETKKHDFSNRFKRSLSLSITAWIWLPAIGRSGGILIGFNESKFILVKFEIGVFSVSLILQNRSDLKAWAITFVYGPITTSLKRPFYDEIRNFKFRWQGPWILAGDFNAIRFRHEKSGKNFDYRASGLFNQLIADLDLSEYLHNGRRFTWRNSKSKVLLDRFLYNQDWNLLAPDSIIQILPSYQSDHNPIILNSKGLELSSPPIFRFNSEWNNVEGFAELIHFWWNSYDIIEMDVTLWNSKLRFLRQKNRGWAHNYYGSVKFEKIKWMDIITSLESDSDHRILSEEESSDLIRAKCSLDNIYINEARYWAQRAKIKWLNFGDANSKFFHRIASQKRKKHLILGLNINNTYSTNLSLIQQHITSFYKKLFGPPSSRWLFLKPDFWKGPNLISEEDIFSLTSPFLESEIKNAVFSPGRIKPLAWMAFLSPSIRKIGIRLNTISLA